jgi:iron complex transport system ATP-binding protein
MAKNVLLRVENICFAYNGRPTLVGVSLQAGSGEVVGLIGPNGSGKSTLLRLISGILRPHSGRIFLNGVPLEQLSRGELARHLAVVPQSPHLPEAFTAWELVLLGRTPHLRLLQAEGPRDAAVAREALETCGVWELAGHRLGELSGGEVQRIVIARALAQQPALLLLDEPTSHLDLNQQTAIMDLVAALAHERRLAVLAVSHDLNLAAQYCDRLIILKEGQVLFEGPPAEVITAANVAAAYGAEVCVVPHPRNSLPVTLVTGRTQTERRRLSWPT